VALDKRKRGMYRIAQVLVTVRYSCTALFHHYISFFFRELRLLSG